MIDRQPESTPREADRGMTEAVNSADDRREIPDARNGAVGGTDGVTKNQDDDAQ